MIKQKLTLILIIILFLLITPRTIYANPNITLSSNTFTVEMLPWDKVKELIPLYEHFEIVDIETGLSFYAQRRAGQFHADVQPMTYRDTGIMKKIYDGKWSWKRKSILVLKNDHILAASMNGMPHGAGAIQNGFPGHFCIHFNQSKTHRSKEIDLAHQLMILKAAGFNKINLYLDNLNKDQLIDTFLVAIKQKDEELIRMIVNDNIQVQTLMKKIEGIESLQKNAVIINLEQPLYLELDAKLNIYQSGLGTIKQTIRLNIVRESIISPWKISAIEFR